MCKIDTHRHSGKDTAAAIGVTCPTLVRWAKDPEFPQPMRITRRIVRYNLDAVKQYLSEKAA